MRFLLPLSMLALAAPAPLNAAETVNLAGFRAVELRGGGSIILVPGAAQRVTIAEGSSAFTRLAVDRQGRLKIDACNSRCPRHYQLRILIQVPRVPDVAISGGGAIRAASGFRPQREVSAAVNGGGKIDLRALEAASASAAVMGGGEILVRARSSLAAAVSGGGAVRYWGNPQVTSSINGGGMVSRGN